MKIFYLPAVFICVVFLLMCKPEEKRLPYLGNVDVIEGDTVYHRVPDISLTDQDSNNLKISQHQDKVIVADFFFTSCPSICPKVKKQMLRVYEKYKDDDRVLILSHTIDQRNDSVSVLNRYAKNLGVNTERWKFVTGVKDSIFQLAEEYYVSAVEDPTAPGGFDHSGRIILLDKNRHVRGFAEGTDPESVTNFIEVIEKLLNEEF